MTWSTASSAGRSRSPSSRGVISQADIAGEIGDLILGQVPGRQREDEITVYDSTGMALLDIAAAKAALALAEAKGLGTVAAPVREESFHGI